MAAVARGREVKEGSVTVMRNEGIIKRANGEPLGRVEGGQIFSMDSTNPVGLVEGNLVMTMGRRQIGRIEGSTILNASSDKIGIIE